MRPRPELRQLLIGMSTNRYFPASGTAGLERSFVSGNNRVPCPPPMMMESTLLALTAGRIECGIKILLGKNMFAGIIRRTVVGGQAATKPGFFGELALANWADACHSCSVGCCWSARY